MHTDMSLQCSTVYRHLLVLRPPALVLLLLHLLLLVLMLLLLLHFLFCSCCCCSCCSCCCCCCCCCCLPCSSSCCLPPFPAHSHTWFFLFLPTATKEEEKARGPELALTWLLFLDDVRFLLPCSCLLRPYSKIQFRKTLTETLQKLSKCSCKLFCCSGLVLGPSLLDLCPRVPVPLAIHVNLWLPVLTAHM